MQSIINNEFFRWIVIQNQKLLKILLVEKLFTFQKCLLCTSGSDYFSIYVCIYVRFRFFPIYVCTYIYIYIYVHTSIHMHTNIFYWKQSFQLQQPGLRCRSINFASITCLHNGSFSCSNISMIFYSISKGSISLGNKIFSGFPGSMISMKQITSFVISTLAQLSSFLIFNLSVNICY